MTGAVASWKAGDAEAALESNGTDRDYHATSDRNLAARWFVWGVWGLLLLANLVLALRFTGPYPYADELHLLTESITPQWLWQQHAEHRVPLAKLIWLGVLQLANYDFRAVNAVSVLSVAATAAAMIMAAGRLRGRVRYSDAFFPLAMLSFGQMQNFLWSWVFNHILPNLIACGLLLVIALRGRELHLRDTFLVAATLVLLFLSGPIGLPYVLAFSVWLGYRATLSWRSPGEPHGRRDGLVTSVLAIAALAVVGLYFAGFHVRQGTAAGVPVPETGLIDAVKASFRILCVSFGPVVVRYVRPLGLVLLGLILASAVVLVRTWLGQPRERLRTAGFLLFIGATGALLFSVGRARAALGWQWHLGGIYLNMAIPALCATYLTCILYGRRSIGELMQTILFIATCLFFLPNFERGIAHGRDYWYLSQEAIAQDIQAGVPTSIIAARRYPQFGVSPPLWTTERLAQKLRLYRELGIPQFRGMASDPDYREVRIPVTPSAVDGAVSKDGVWYSCSLVPENASLAFSLDRSRFVYAIQVRCSYEDEPTGLADPKMAWSAGNATETWDRGGPRVPSVGALLVSKTPFRAWDWGDRVRDDRNQTLTFWVNSEIDRFRIHPDTKAFALKVSEIVLLVAPDDPLKGDPKR